MRIAIELNEWSEVQRFIDALDASGAVKVTVKTLVVKAYEYGVRKGTQYPSGSIISTGPADETPEEESCRRTLMDRYAETGKIKEGGATVVNPGEGNL